MPLLRRLSPYLVLLVSALLMMQANPFADQTLAPMGLLVSQPGWQSTQLSLRIAHPQRTDVLDGRLPSWLYLKDQLRTGKLPLWNPLRVNGKPGLQTITQSALTPAFVAFVAIPNDALGFYLAGLVNLLIAGVGTFLLLRLATGDTLASLFGALVFAYCGFHAAWFYWPHVMSSIWIPWLLFAVARYLENGRPSQLPAIALVSALMLLGGFPSVAVFGFGAACLLLLIHLLHSGHWLRLPWLLLCFAAGFALTLVTLWPLIEQLQHAGVGYRRGGTILRLADFALFLDPEYKGQPRVETTVYFGRPALAFALLGVLGYWLGWLRGDPYARFGVWLGLIAVSIAFGLVHGDLIRALPTMNSNPWQRISVLIALAGAVLSALALAHLLPRLARRQTLVTLTVCLLLVLQFYDQRHLFREFNRAVPGAAFFPSTPTIEQMRAELRPMQSVMGDAKLYLGSGVLTAYGLPEWFAHGFRSQAEKRALGRLQDSPFVTRTAAEIRCPLVTLDADMLARFGVRYLACPDSARPLLPNAHAPACQKQPILNGTGLSMEFGLSEAKRVGALLLPFAPGLPSDLAGTLELRLLRGDTGLAAAHLAAARLPDPGPARFDFQQQLQLPPGRYHLELNWEGAVPGADLRLSAVQAGTGQQRLWIDGEALACGLALQYEPLPGLDPPGLNSSRPEPGVRLFENDAMGPESGAYFLPVLQTAAPAEFSNVSLASAAADHYALDYKGQAEGWVVLPLRAYPGWQARVNGHQVDYQKLFGLMPAIPVSGPSRLEYRYLPVQLYLTAGASALAWLLLFAAYPILRRLERRKGRTGPANRPALGIRRGIRGTQ